MADKTTEKTEKKKTSLKEWIREGGLFIIFSYVVTFLKYLMLQFLPTFYHNLVGDVEWLFPGIPVNLFGVNFKLSIIGNALETAADGSYLLSSGLAFTLANLTAIVFGECVNFPLQRNITFRSHGPVAPQIAMHGIATIVVFLVMNLFTCLWNPLAGHFGVPDFLFNIVTTVVTGGVSMVIIFAVDKTIFAPGWGEKK